MTPAQVDSAWNQVQVNFHECPTCQRIVCLSDFDTQSGFCQEDSPRSQQITEARSAQAGAALKGFASPFGLGEAIDKAKQAAKEPSKRAAATLACCPKDGTTASVGTKFSPECGSPMIQPSIDRCPNCVPRPGVLNSARTAAQRSSALRLPPSIQSAGPRPKALVSAPNAGIK